MHDGFSAGRIISTGFSIATKNAHIMLPLAILFFLPLIIYTVWLVNNLTLDNLETYERLSGLIGIPVNGLLTATLLHATMAALKGEPVQLGTSVKVGFRRLLPVVLTSLLVGFVIGIATLLLIIPGLIAMCYLWVALPAVVLENSGVVDSMSRSAQLTEGYRWPIFGIAMLSAGLAIVAGIVLFMIVRKGGMEVETMLYLSVGIEVVVSVLGAVFAAATYFELRRVKEDVELNELAEAFD